MATRKRRGAGRICPRCGSTETVAVSVGWPVPELGQKEGPFKGPPGSRTLGIDNPDRVCRKCGHQWLSRG
jgi:hypothetical protein